MLGELIISAIVVGCVVKALGSRSSRRPLGRIQIKEYAANAEIP